MTISDTSTHAPARYQARIDRLTHDHAAVQQRWSLLANLRLVLFIVLAIAAWQWWAAGSLVAGGFVLLALIAIIPVVVVHRRLRRRRDRLARLVRVNELGRDRAALAWDRELPHSQAMPPSPAHPYARDLNIVGDASVMRRIGTPVTASGWHTLQQWLLEPAPVEVVHERQRAVSELGAAIDLRQDVEQAGLDRETDPAGLTALLEWAESSRVLAGKSWLVVLAWLGPLAVVLLALAQVFGVLALPLWVLALAFNLILTQLVAGRAAVEVDRVGSVARALDGYGAIVERLRGTCPESPILTANHEALFGDDGGAAGRIRELARATSFIMPRGSLLYLPIQMVFAWDIHVAAALDRWKAASGGRLRGWLDVIGEWEALAALGVLAWDHPEWAMPGLAVGHERIDAGGLRHPLLPDELAVGNDVMVGPPGTFLFVTGSNMSGKSTLLRAIGTNVVLAQAGAPVAANRTALPPLDIVTTMRVEDSLAHGVSFFLAELHRLKQVIDAADAAAVRPVLYLLDEMLQGTNTAERQIASRRVLRHLTTTCAIGAVSSHDLTLIAGSGLEDDAVTVHFSEQFDEAGEEPAMSFDYRLRPGLATSSNALALMRMLGFPEEQGEDGGG